MNEQCNMTTEMACQLAYERGVADERERCARLVESGGDGFPDLIEVAIRNGPNQALAAAIRSGLACGEIVA